MRKHLEYEIILNCLLIEKEIRQCFLFWCKKTLKLNNFIKKRFPNLIITDFSEFAKKNNLNSSDVLLISKRYLDKSEYNTDEKLGKLLGYLSADNFNNINKNEPLYNYGLKAIIDKSEINLFGELSQNKLNYEPLRNKTYDALKDIVEDIIIIERNFVYNTK
jgi:hypothetical protein